MPTSREGTAPLQDLDPGMSNPLDFSNTDLGFDADDWMNDSSPPLLDDYYNQDPDALQSLESTRLTDQKRFLSPGPNFAFSQSGLSPESSLSSSQDSASVSSSSKRTQSSSSPQTRSSGDDIAMSDGPNVKQELNYDDYLNMDDDQPMGLDGTVNPKSIEQPFGRNDYSQENSFDFHSDSCGSTPDDPTQTAPSPEMEHANINTAMKTSSPHNRGHNKVFSQYSLTHGMSGLKTNGSREVSPTSGYIFSQDSSPTAVFNSPSPGMALDFAANPPLGQGLESAPFPNGLPPASLHGGLPPPPYSNYPISLTGVPPYAMFSRASFDQTPPTYRLHVDKIPLKSRVETQIPIKLRLSPMPPGVKRLHLPAHTISKPKLLAKPRAERSQDMLELYTNLVCTSSMQTEKNKHRALARAAASSSLYDLAPNEEDDENKPANGGDIRICKGCIQRERKRADRKKSKKPEEEESWRRDEERRVIVFNTHEIKDWQPPTPNPGAGSEFMMDGLVDAPMRIACYCRHHSEKSGFQVIFTIKDWQDRVIAQAFSDSIMITDDHKTHPMPNITTAALKGQDTSLMTPPSANPPTDQLSLGRGPAFRPSHSTSDLPALERQSISFQPTMLMHKPPQPQPPPPVPAPRNLSRPASPGMQGPTTKKRKANSSTIHPTDLAMTRLETAHFPTSQAPNAQLNGPMSGTTSPFSPNMPAFPPTSSDPLFAPKQTGHGPVPQPFTNGPPTPNSNTDQVFFSNNNRSSSLDNLTMTQIYSAPVSAHPSRAPSPNALRNSVSVNTTHQQAQLSHAFQSNLFNLPMGLNMGGSPASIINKVIPGEGPKCGGIEVTILGQGFYQGLDVMFGDQKATTTTYWGENSLVCLVPPSSAAITVPVSLRQPNQQYVQQFPSQSRVTFRYTDDDEQQLLRQALTVLSKKMTGKLEDAKDIARRIVESSTGGGGPTGGGNITGYSASGANFEAQLLKVLELIDLDDSSYKARLNLQRRSTGQSMLHHACALGLHRFVAGLLARGADPDIRDNGGYTPLHLAALNDQREIARRLIHARADPTIRTLSGETAADLVLKKVRTPASRELLRILQRIERQHIRSRSGGSLYSRASRASRASSATSLKSLWEPPSAPSVWAEYKTDDFDSGVESPEYSQFASSDDEHDEGSDQEWLDMRRSSVHSRRALDVTSVSRLPSPRGDIPAAPGSPASAAMGAFKEQLAAHFQQFLAQIPSSITIPPNPLPDYYQSYINSATFQRLTSLMPNINGSRPGSSRDEPVSKDMESRWWDLSSFMPSYGMPPAYEEIFPQQQNMDTKQVSAAAAAAEYEADSKCATLYDQPTTSESSARQQLPVRLKIGRKNAITREQQENFRRAHAERRKGLSRDTSLYMFWIPILVLVLAAWFPGVFTKAWSYLPTVTFNADAVAQIRQGA